MSRSIPNNILINTRKLPSAKELLRKITLTLILRWSQAWRQHLLVLRESNYLRKKTGLMWKKESCNCAHNP